MLTIAISLLFGLVAFAALAQINAAVGLGVRRARVILAELSRTETRVSQARPPLSAAPWFASA